MPALCRDCLAEFDAPPGPRCPACRGPRLLVHPELRTLALAHIDCDAFYAAIEKRDDPRLADRPLIVGGGRRGVVTTCCYIARISGVRSAMPMFKALKLCPDAVVLRPRMEVYATESRRIRALMNDLTPLVEPLSLDEAFLDLSGTERLLGAAPALSLARLAARIEREIGITVSIGLSHNKSLAKLASDDDKPRGFTVIGREETCAYLARQPVTRLWGVGGTLAAKLGAEGVRTVEDLVASGEEGLIRRHGAMGQRLWRLATGRDDRAVVPDRPVKSISSETTFDADIVEREALEGHLWRLAVRTSDRAKARAQAGHAVVLKVKTADFRTLTRRTSRAAPTNLAGEIFETGRTLLAGLLARGPFRLVGIGISELAPAGAAEAQGLLDERSISRARIERVTDEIRARFGGDTIFRGRSLR